MKQSNDFILKLCHLTTLICLVFIGIYEIVYEQNISKKDFAFVTILAVFNQISFLIEIDDN